MHKHKYRKYKKKYLNLRTMETKFGNINNLFFNETISYINNFIRVQDVNIVAMALYPNAQIYCNEIGDPLIINITIEYTWNDNDYFCQLYFGNGSGWDFDCDNELSDDEYDLISATIDFLNDKAGYH